MSCTLGNYGLLVKNWQFNAADPVPDGIFTHTLNSSVLDQAGVAGQNTKNPPSDFTSHFVVSVDVGNNAFRIYDPSYGNMFDGNDPKKAWENGSAAGFAKAGNPIRAKPNDVNKTEVVFTNQ